MDIKLCLTELEAEGGEGGHDQLQGNFATAACKQPS